MNEWYTSFLRWFNEILWWDGPTLHRSPQSTFTSSSSVTNIVNPRSTVAVGVAEDDNIVTVVLNDFFFLLVSVTSHPPLGILVYCVPDICCYYRRLLNQCRPVVIKPYPYKDERKKRTPRLQSGYPNISHLVSNSSLLVRLQKIPSCLRNVLSSTNVHVEKHLLNVFRILPTSPQINWSTKTILVVSLRPLD